jgi:hypothetical protein
MQEGKKGKEVCTFCGHDLALEKSDGADEVVVIEKQQLLLSG